MSNPQVGPCEEALLHFSPGSFQSAKPLPGSREDGMAGKGFVRQISWIDWVVVISFLLFAIAYQIGRLGSQTEVVDLTSDTANIASFAAAWNHPEQFAADAVLNNPENFRFYQTIHIPLLRILGERMGSYGRACLSLMGIHLFCFLLGWYLFGMVLLRQRLLAYLLPWLLAIPFVVGFGDFWGFYPDPLPRVTFAAVLGYLLAAALHWRDRPKAHFWLLFTAGLFIYVHPVSAPVIGCALWMGFLLDRPPAWNNRQFFLHLLWIGIGFLIPIIPFAIHYLGHHEHGWSANADFIHEMMAYRFGADFLHPLPAFKGLLGTLSSSGLLPLGLLGAILIHQMDLPEQKKRLRLMVGWSLGIMIASMVIPLFEHLLFISFGVVPVEVDLVRGVRFFVPLLWILAIWSLAVLTHRFPAQGRPLVVVVPLVVVMLGAYILMGLSGPRSAVLLLGKQMAPYINQENGWQQTLQDWRIPGPLIQKISLLREKFATFEKNSNTLLLTEELVAAIRRLTPKGARILPFGVDPLVIRYAALRPIGFSYKDGGILLYANHRAARDWYEISKRIDHLQEMLADPRPDAEWQSQLALVFDAILTAVPTHFLVTDDTLPAALWEDRGGKVIWRNNLFLLVQLDSPLVGGKRSDL